MDNRSSVKRTRTSDHVDIDNLTPVIPSVRPALDPFEMITSPVGHMERWRADAIMTGAIQHFIQIRDDAVEATARLHQTLARVDAAVAQRGMIQSMCDQMTELSKRIDALELRHKADQEEEERQREFEEEPLSEPPGTDAALAPEPTGDLHDLQAKQEPDPLDMDKPDGELPEPPLRGAESDMEGVQMSYRNVPTSYVRGRGPQDAEGDLPPELETLEPEPAPEPTGKVFPQPTAISLNQE